MFDFTYRVEQNTTGYDDDPDYFLAGYTRDEAIQNGKKQSLKKHDHIVFVYAQTDIGRNNPQRDEIARFLNGDLV